MKEYWEAPIAAASAELMAPATTLCASTGLRGDVRGGQPRGGGLGRLARERGNLLGKGDGCEAAGIVRLGRRSSRPHGWRESVRSPKPLGPADAAWRAAYAALTGPARAQRRGLTRAVALAPGRPAFLIIRGLCHLVVRNGLEVTQDPAALADLEAAVEAEARSPWAPLALGMAEYLSKRMRRARELFEEAARRDPPIPGWSCSRPTRCTITSFPKPRRFEAAVRPIPTARELGPSRTPPLSSGRPEDGRRARPRWKARAEVG